MTKEVHGGIYFYNHRQNLQENGIIYKTDREVYETAEYLDTMSSGLAMFATYKVCRNLYSFAVSQPWSPYWTLGWAVIAYA